MGDLAKAGAAVVCCVLLLGQCGGDTGTAIKTGAGAAGVGAAVGVGIGAGAAGAGAIAGGKRGVSKRVEDAVSGRNRKPTKPRSPRNPTTTTGVPSPSIPPTTTTRPKADMSPEWCITVSNGVCVKVNGGK